MLDNIEIWQFVLLFLTALIAGFVDSMAGGGGLITLPALMSVGIPPQIVLGTNKLQATFGSFSAAIKFWRQGLVKWSVVKYGILYTFLGAISGALLISKISADILNRLIPILLIIIVIYFIFSPNLGLVEKKAKVKSQPFFLIFGLLLGFYDGFFGPGTGSFWVVMLIILNGYNLLKATAYTKVLNFVSNFASLLVFAYYGKILFSVGIIMAIGQIVGSLIGSHIVIQKGSHFIKPVFITAVSILTLSLIYKNW